VFKDLHVAYATDWGGAESCANPHMHQHPPPPSPADSSLLARQHRRETCMILRFVETSTPGKCDRCAYAPTMSPRKGPARDGRTLVRRFGQLFRRRNMLSSRQICFMISSSKRASTKLLDNATATNGRASTHNHQHLL
jgi:hypothetical protein